MTVKIKWDPLYGVNYNEGRHKINWNSKTINTIVKLEKIQMFQPYLGQTN